MADIMKPAVALLRILSVLKRLLPEKHLCGYACDGYVE